MKLANIVDFKVVIEQIENAKNIVILPHVSTDGDSLGSTMALYLAVKQLGKEAIIYLEEEMQKKYELYTSSANFVLYNSDEQHEHCDLCIAVDCGDKKRLGSRIQIFESADMTVSIDHHLSNDSFAEINVVNTSWSATAEGMFQLLKQMNVSFNKDVAQALYIGILTDTGSFKHNNTTADTHMIAAELIGYGLDVSEIAQQVYDFVSPGKFRLNGLIPEITEFYADGKIAVCYLKNEYIESCNADHDDIDGVSDYIRSINGVEVAVLVKDSKAHKDELKVSLRSKRYVNVNVIAQEFNGGGHIRAAGLSSKLDYEQLKTELVNRIEMEL